MICKGRKVSHSSTTYPNFLSRNTKYKLTLFPYLCRAKVVKLNIDTMPKNKMFYEQLVK